MGFADEVMSILKDAVKKEGSAKNLAQHVGLNAPTLTRWLTGLRDPTLKNLGLVMDYLGVTLAADTKNGRQKNCPNLEAECSRLRSVVAEQSIRLDELRALLKPTGIDAPQKTSKLG